MTAQILEQIRPEIKTSIGGQITFYNIDALEKALCADPVFMDRCRNCNFYWPGEIAPISTFAHWLLEQAERLGDAEAALENLTEYLAAPRKTWQSAVVCTVFVVQHEGFEEG